MKGDPVCLKAVRGLGCGYCYRQVIPESDGCLQEGVRFVRQNGARKHAFSSLSVRT
ncbi:hypothetical protein DPMN_011974 [Dreissena polymorpha]|uniref:Uncharacterized protein n=1 Tax=Dreissena polymorpha TaxID=45954 RepID=A0A9D4N752_DREPO|nr:hypothetical protein DPMN_011974 [Dreissena polymorpha]